MRREKKKSITALKKIICFLAKKQKTDKKKQFQIQQNYFYIYIKSEYSFN